MKKLSDRDILKLVHWIVSGDLGQSAEIALSNGEVRGLSRDLAEAFEQIYRIVHSHILKCNHPDWEKETLEFYEELKKEL